MLECVTTKGPKTTGCCQCCTAGPNQSSAFVALQLPNLCMICKWHRTASANLFMCPANDLFIQLKFIDLHLSTFSFHFLNTKLSPFSHSFHQEKRWDKHQRACYQTRCNPYSALIAIVVAVAFRTTFPSQASVSRVKPFLIIHGIPERPLANALRSMDALQPRV